MQELRLVAVSEDGTYAVLAVPGRGGRFSLPIDDRLRTVVRGQFSRLAQYEIEVENPLRPKEIQDRIRAGETADEIADAAGIPIDRVRRFEGPVLAEREYRAQEAQRSTVRGHTESGPGPRLGEIVLERLAEAGARAEELAWDSRKRADGNWQVQLQFMLEGRPQIAEWVFDPRRRHVIPGDDIARRLCLPQVDWPAGRLGGLGAATATVTPIGSRLGAHHSDARTESDRAAARAAHAASAGTPAAPHARPEAVPAEPRPEPVRPEAPRPEPARPAAREWSRDPAPAADPAPARETAQASPAPAAQTASPAPGRPASRPPAAASQQEVSQNATAQGEAAAAPPAAPEETAKAPEPAEPATPARPGRKSAKNRRSSVPSWDEIMLGNSRD
jgi:DUF3071 family protein